MGERGPGYRQCAHLLQEARNRARLFQVQRLHPPPVLLLHRQRRRLHPGHRGLTSASRNRPVRRSHRGWPWVGRCRGSYGGNGPTNAHRHIGHGEKHPRDVITWQRSVKIAFGAADIHTRDGRHLHRNPEQIVPRPPFENVHTCFCESSSHAAAGFISCGGAV